MLTQEEWLCALLASETQGAPLVGRYINFEPLSQADSGAFSIVLRAHDLRTNKSVALKFYSPWGPFAQDQYRLGSFYREVEVAKALVGRENIIQLVGDIESIQIQLNTAGGIPTPPVDLRFYAVELARESFAAFLFGKRRPRPTFRRLEVLREVAKGLARLHRRNYCHRDLKPDNIFLFSKGTAKVADLGTCRHVSGIDPLALSYHMPAGSFLYSAPEMFNGGGALPALYEGGDWFSFGAVLFEALVGQNLYVAIGLNSPGEIVRALSSSTDLRLFEKETARISGAYPIPDLSGFSEDWLNVLSPDTLAGLTRLVQDLCNFDHKRRLKDFDTIMKRLDIAALRSKIDHERFHGIRPRTRR